MKTDRKKKQAMARNAELLRKYPFLKPVLADESDYDGTWTMLDFVCLGWQGIFLEACDEISSCLEKAGIDPSGARFYDVKEKYGMLRADFSPCVDGITEILSRLEERSLLYCPSCGKPTKYVTKGYVWYLCEDCAKKAKLDKEPLTAADIPYYTIYESGGNGDAKAKKTRKPAYYQREFEKQWI